MTPERLRRDLGEQAEELRANWVPEDLVVHIRGDVAWVAVRLVVHFDDASELEYRATLVFVVEGDDWSLAHSHLSVGV
jgi:ketosteroid isomerase-like protein